jgi:hypothetical protein
MITIYWVLYNASRAMRFFSQWRCKTRVTYLRNQIVGLKNKFKPYANKNSYLCKHDFVCLNKNYEVSKK